jgi:hypothetical protein
MAQRRANGAALGCEACHNVRSWADVNGFDHSKTKFPLLGAHRAVNCAACHKVPAGQKAVQFKGTSQICRDCHKDAHAGQFAKAGKTPCSGCRKAGIICADSPRGKTCNPWVQYHAVDHIQLAG